MPVILLTGTVGVGKTTVAVEISEVLAEREVPHAAVDLDSLIFMWPWTSKWHSDLMFQNLAALWPNYQAHGATRLVLANVLEDVTDLNRYRDAVPGAEITTVRLVAPETSRMNRLTARIPEGSSREWHLARTRELDEILERLSLEDFIVDNGDRTVRSVAVEILHRAGWT